MKRKREDEGQDADDVRFQKTDDMYRLLVRAIARSAAKGQFQSYNFNNAFTSKITQPFGSLTCLLQPVTLIEITTNIAWSSREKESDNIKTIEIDAAILKQYYLLLWSINAIRKDIDECDKQLNGPAELRKMGDVPYIESIKADYVRKYNKAKTGYFDVFVGNNPRLAYLLGKSLSKLLLG